jgi:hypothetical protein
MAAGRASTVVSGLTPRVLLTASSANRGNGTVTIVPLFNTTPLAPEVGTWTIDDSTSSAVTAKYVAMLSSERRSARLASCASSLSLGSGAGLLGMSRGRRSHPILRMRHAASASAEIYLPLCGVGVSTAHSIA